MNAQCQDCGKTYRVREAGKQYRCKECGGTVVVAAEPPVAVHSTAQELGLAPCPSCEALNPEGSRFCEECGTDMRRTPPAGRPRSAARDRETDRQERRELSQAIGTATAIRNFALAIAGLSLVQIITGLLLGLYSSDAQAAILLGIQGLPALVGGYCGFAALRRPVLSSILLLALMTPIALLLLVVWIIVTIQVGLALDVTLWTGCWILITLALWALFPQMMRLKRLMRQHPDSWIMRHRRGEDREAGEVSQRMREKAGAAARRGRWRWLAIGGGAVALFAVIVTTVHHVSQPAPFEDAVASMTEVWNRGDAAALAQIYTSDEGKEDERTRRLGRVFDVLRERAGMDPALPPPNLILADAKDRQVGDTWIGSAEFTFVDEVVRGRLRTSWTYDGTRWVLKSIVLPKRER